MRGKFDPLYEIFEQHLFNALVEDEGTDEFLARVVLDYMGRLSAMGTTIPNEHRSTVETDLREEVLEMLRKKTYGFYNLAEFRKAKANNPHPTATPPPQGLDKTTAHGRRNRRAC